MDIQQIHLKTLKEIQQGLRSGHITVSQLVDFYLENIRKHSHLNAYVEVYEAEIIENAIKLDAKIKQSPDTLGKLFGCVISIKDLICYKNHKISAGSKILDGFESQFSATAVDLVIAEDALIIGRTNCDEFGMGSTNRNSYFGPVGNGIDKDLISGGSSGGAAVSVQINSCAIALGTDTGGSVRQPASMCGVIGYKPSYGMVSRHGLIAYASSFDQLGILGHHISDIDLVTSCVSVNDGYDATMFQSGLYKDQAESVFDKPKLKIAYFEEAIENDALNVEIKTSILGYCDKLRAEGVTIDKIKFPFLDFLVPCYYILTTAEASSNLSRYDGVRYGYRASEPKNLEDLYFRTRTEGFGKEVKKRIMLGSYVLSEAYYDAYFTKAQQVRRKIRDYMKQVFREYDFIILPTCTRTAWRNDEVNADPLEEYMSDMYTVLANIAGCSAISIPLGKDMVDKPYSVQFLADQGNDNKLLTNVAKL